MTSDPWRVCPLQRARKDGTLYVREPDVEAQLRELSGLGDRERRERIGIADRSHPQFVREEALVFCLRAYQTRGDTDTAWRIAELLVERVARHVTRKLQRWRMTADEMEECARDLFTDLQIALFDGGPASEFWEVRFWVCLDRRLWNLAEKRQAVLDLAQKTNDRGEDGEAGEDPIARIADPGLGPEQMAEYRDALAVLNENERVAMYLRYVEGLPEESEDPLRPSLARVLGVTGRIVRNYLRRAEAKLQAWQRGDENSNGNRNAVRK